MSRTRSLDFEGFETMLGQNFLRASKGLAAARSSLGALAGEPTAGEASSEVAQLREDFPGQRTLAGIDRSIGRATAGLEATNRTVVGIVASAAAKGIDALIAAKNETAVRLQTSAPGIPDELDAQLKQFRSDLGADHPWTSPERRAAIGRGIDAMKGAMTVMSSYGRGAYAAATGYMAHLSTDPSLLEGMEPGRSFASLVRTGESVSPSRPSTDRWNGTRQVISSMAAHRARVAASPNTSGPDLR